MEIIYTLVYHPKVISDDLPKLNGSWKKKVKSSMEGKLLSDPLLYGKPLRRDLYGCYKLRVGDYRVIYFLKIKTVYVIAIRHRREVYDTDFKKRL
jgi:mRNA-degrading endonuclease RelE of RelBE toxin-antitoxin system